MGTRATIRVIDYEHECQLVNIYVQSDGYPEYLGIKLAKFLDKIKIINGIGRETKNVANGAGCLAAQLIAHLKKGVGEVYITTINDEQEYDYRVYVFDHYVSIEGD